MAASFKADDRRASQWYIDYMKAPAAWEILEANVPSLTPAKVAIIDAGASLDHLDLSNVVNREQSIEVIHGEDSDLSSWKWQPLRGDGYVNGSAGVRGVLKPRHACFGYCDGRSWQWWHLGGRQRRSYDFKSSGAMATNQWVGRYHVDTSGKWDKTR